MRSDILGLVLEPDDNGAVEAYGVIAPAGNEDSKNGSEIAACQIGGYFVASLELFRRGAG